MGMTLLFFFKHIHCMIIAAAASSSSSFDTHSMTIAPFLFWIAILAHLIGNRVSTSFTVSSKTRTNPKSLDHLYRPIPTTTSCAEQQERIVRLYASPYSNNNENETVSDNVEGEGEGEEDDTNNNGGSGQLLLEVKDWWNPLTHEQSQIPEYIASFLNDQQSAALPFAAAAAEPTGTNNPDDDDDDDYYYFTHMIGIPMDQSHELLLELTSVQRAILYHCPILVHACITGSMTRMPLLYVSADSSSSSQRQRRRPSSAQITRTLHDIVERVVQQVIYQKEQTTVTQQQQPPEMVINPVANDEEEFMCGVNPDGYRPLVLGFENLEIDGVGNQVLSTVGVENDHGSKQLIQLVNVIKSEIEALGWTAVFPIDDHSQTNNTFRPRVPFMRLPSNFDSYLEPINNDEDDDDDDDGGNENWMRTSDEGGNGISPIFWCQWWEDSFAQFVRLREVSIYPRQPSAALDTMDEQAFYIPHETTILPKGNAALSKVEARAEAYNEKRMAEMEEQMTTSSPASLQENTGKDKGEEQRERLESIYNAIDNKTDAIGDAVLDKIDPPVDAMSCKDETPRMEEEEELDDWTKERIRKTVEARAFVQSQKVQDNKDRPKIEDNVIFKKYRDGTLVDKRPRDDGATASSRELPAYPSREHFFGIWRVISSPTGWPEEVGDDTKSDNLILRVDGTIAGGPSLDRETNQKASGGTWKMLNSTDDNGTKLRIRLVIPPKKERILVMEGEVTRITSAMDMPLSRSTFGIPELEAAAQKRQDDSEDLIHCGGPVWIEDALTGKNREEIGTFSLMKLQSPLEPGKYTITIPGPVRSQD